MLIPIVLVALTGVSVFKGGRKDPFYGKMTQERSSLYQSALASKTLSADELIKLADMFEKNGLKAESVLLRNRGRLRGLPPKQKLQRKQILRKAMASTDPDAVEQVANVFEKQGATGSANTLRMMVIGLRNASKIKPIESSPPPAPAEMEEAKAVEPDTQSLAQNAESNDAGQSEN